MNRLHSLSLFSLVAFGLAAGCTTSVPAPVVDRSVRPTVVPQLEAPSPSQSPVVSVYPAVPGNTAGSQFHVVQRGETLYGIARVNNVDVNALAAWNNMAPGQTLRDGQVLRLSPPLGSAPAVTAPGTVISVVPIGGAIQGQPLPPGTGFNTTPGAPSPAATQGSLVTPIEAPLKREPKSQRLAYTDAAFAAAQRGDAPLSPLATADARTVAPNALPPLQPSPPSPVPSSATMPSASAVETEIKPGGGVDRDGISWTWPTSGKVASKFSDKAPMKGIDIAANAGTAVVAAATGKVIYVGKEPRGYGQMIVINHAKETVSVYFHTDKVQVKEQQRVLLGQKLAEVADGTGNKMHFEVRRQGRPLDPISLMPR